MKNKKMINSTAFALIVVMLFSVFSLACSNRKNKPVAQQEESSETATTVVEAPKIVDLSTNGYITIAIKSDGTISWVGGDETVYDLLGSWTDISKVIFGADFCMGLKNDGTVVAAGDNAYGQCNVGGWSNITQLVAGTRSNFVVGLKADGVVVATGENEQGQCNVSGWTGARS